MFKLINTLYTLCGWGFWGCVWEVRRVEVFGWKSEGEELRVVLHLPLPLISHSPKLESIGGVELLNIIFQEELLV